MRETEKKKNDINIATNMLHIVKKSLILHILYIHRPYLLGKTRTMNEEKKTPLWLDLRKEYIDDNFAKLQEYLI